MSESKVVVHEFFNEEDVLTKWITHADYKALERTMVGYRNMWDASERELASLKARVRELPKKNPETDNREWANGWNACRLALEALS